MISFFQTFTSVGKNNKKEQNYVPASLFAQDENFGIEDYPFQLLISEEHGLEFRVSDHPVQDGSTISDHVTQELRRLVVKGMFTNRSLNSKNGTLNFEKNNEIVVNDAKAITNVAREKYLALEALASKREPVRIVTSMMTYPKMVITSIKTSRDEKSSDCVIFTMELRELEIVTLKEIRDSYTYDPKDMESAKNRQIANKKNSGKVSAEKKEADKLLELVDEEFVK